MSTAHAATGPSYHQCSWSPSDSGLDCGSNEIAGVPYPPTPRVGRGYNEAPNLLHFCFSPKELQAEVGQYTQGDPFPKFAACIKPCREPCSPSLRRKTAQRSITGSDKSSLIRKRARTSDGDNGHRKFHGETISFKPLDRSETETEGNVDDRNTASDLSGTQTDMACLGVGADPDQEASIGSGTAKDSPEMPGNHTGEGMGDDTGDDTGDSAQTPSSSTDTTETLEDMEDVRTDRNDDLCGHRLDGIELQLARLSTAMATEKYVTSQAVLRSAEKLDQLAEKFDYFAVEVNGLMERFEEEFDNSITLGDDHPESSRQSPLAAHDRANGAGSRGGYVTGYIGARLQAALCELQQPYGDMNLIMWEIVHKGFASQHDSRRIKADICTMQKVLTDLSTWTWIQFYA
ncbi:hypothetical protein S40288_11205 [Stachybotrys chartarum IBT 40288]|nr:hypothetical protein S40288_11205 [Stachybotrys chartarum IBT 40288]